MSVMSHQPVYRERGEREPIGIAKDFDFQIPTIYVMFKLTIWVADTDDRVILNFQASSLMTLVLRIRIKGFNRYILYCTRIEKAESRFAVFFQATDDHFTLQAEP